MCRWNILYGALDQGSMLIFTLIPSAACQYSLLFISKISFCNMEMFEFANKTDPCNS